MKPETEKALMKYNTFICPSCGSPYHDERDASTCPCLDKTLMKYNENIIDLIIKLVEPEAKTEVCSCDKRTVGKMKGKKCKDCEND